MQCTPRTSRVNAKALLVAVGIALATSVSVQAKQSDRNEVVDIHAKTFDGSQQPQGIVTYTTGVIITQGTLKITGAKAKVFLNNDNSVKQVIIDGSPATIHQLDDQNQPMDGQAANIDYKVEQDFAVLTGNAKVNQPAKGSAEGDKLTYNTKDSTMTGESNGAAPVHMTFQPKNKTPATAPAKPTPDTKKP